MKIAYSKKADKVLKALDKKTEDRIREAVRKIPEGDIKPLEGYSDGRLRLRIGKYRAVFYYIDAEKNMLFVLAVGSRGDIYK